MPSQRSKRRGPSKRNYNKRNGPSRGPNATAITALFWNAGGSSSSKFCEFKTILTRESADVFAIVEAGASTDSLDYYKCKDYVIYTLPRSRQIASGIIVGVRNTITAKFRVLHKMQANKFEAVELNLWKNNTRTKLIFAYNPPGNSPMTQILENALDRNTIILGDFNSHSLRWGYKNTDPIGKTMEDFLDSSATALLKSTGYTFLSFKGEKTNPDLAIVHSNIASTTSLNLLESSSGYGHRILCVRRLPKMPSYQPDSVFLPRWNLRKANWASFSHLTDLLLTPDLIDENNADKSYDAITEAIRLCALETIPKGKVKRYRPFWTKELTSLKTKRGNARIQAELMGDIVDNIALRRAHSILKRAIKHAKRDCFKNFTSILDFRKDDMRAHRYLSTLNNEHITEKNEPLVSHGRQFNTNSEKALALAKHYASVCRLSGSSKKSKNLQRPPTGCLNHEEDMLFNGDFTSDELQKAMKETKRGKSAGPNDLPADFFLHLGKSAEYTLLFFFNSIWKTHVPADWRKAIIVPILKPHKAAEDPSSYRPISLTNACCKLMERMVANRLNFFLETNNKISDLQAGFRKKRGTIEQATFLSQCVKDGFHRKESTLAVYVDFKSAYDSVWLKKLTHKMQNIGIQGHMLKWFRSFLCQRHAKVKYKSAFSRYVQMRNGLPQGAVTSCFLFNIMINDLIEKLQNLEGVQCLVFADDIAIFSTNQNTNNANDNINKAMTLLENWCEDNKMTVNVEKTVYQLFTLSTKEHPVSIKYKNQDLCKQDSFRYLGVFFDNKLSWRIHAEETAGRGENRLSLLKRLTGVTWGSTPDVLSNVYKSYIRPVLDYGGELLATASESCCDRIDKVQNKALRLITSAACSTPIAAMEIQSGLEPLKIRREKQLLKQFEKCRRLPVRHWQQAAPALKRLKTHHSFLTKAEDLMIKYKIKNFPCQSFCHSDRFPPTFRIPPLNLSIDINERKSDVIPDLLRAHALEVITNRYPKETWLHIYTDGSSQGDSSSGAGFYCEDLFEGSYPVGINASNFEAEVEAIRQSALHLSSCTTSLNHAVFLVDSQSAILSLCSLQNSESIRVEETKLKIDTLINDGWVILFQWLPSHCDIPGNERADRLAKHGCSLPQPAFALPYNQVFSTITRATNNYLKNVRDVDTAGKSWSSLIRNPLPMDLPRQIFSANFRVTTGHDYLQAHLHRIGVLDVPDCPLCSTGEILDFDHLTSCASMANITLPSDNYLLRATLYWAAREAMAHKANSST